MAHFGIVDFLPENPLRQVPNKHSDADYAARPHTEPPQQLMAFLAESIQDNFQPQYLAPDAI